MRAVTLRVSGSMRSTWLLTGSRAQTAPKPAESDDRLSAHIERVDHLRLDRLGVVVQLQDADRHGQREQRHGQRGRQRRRAGEAAAGAHDPLGGRRAALLAQRRLAQLELQLGDEVLVHRRAPIRVRIAASPRLTRLRTTASDVSSSPAISP